MRRPLPGGKFRQAIAKPAQLGPEYNPWFWNPNNPSVRFADPWFREQVKAMDADLDVTWNPIRQRWQVWARAPRVQTPVCSGWRLLFIHHGADQRYLPLDERVFARIYQIDATKQGDARQYFERIVAEMERDKAKRDMQWTQDSIDAAMPSFDHSQIQISMRGKSSGSKFSKYHS